MKILIICDKDEKTAHSEVLKQNMIDLFTSKKYEVKVIEVGEKDVKSCIGCFGCWIKQPGKCIFKGLIEEINEHYVNDDKVIYLTPILFGQYSSNMKNVLDRTVNYLLPFFETVNGTTKHPLRYGRTQEQIFIGYGDDINKKEAATFNDLINKHGRKFRNVFISTDENNITPIINKLEKII